MIHLFYDTSILRYKLSTQIAPKGAVIKIDKTATVNTVCPHASPIASGTAPMAACTVAFGVYASMQNIFSLLVSSEPSRQSHTPAMRNSKAASLQKHLPNTHIGDLPLPPLAQTE